jgi:hypothetical protein
MVSMSRSSAERSLKPGRTCLACILSSVAAAGEMMAAGQPKASALPRPQDRGLTFGPYLIEQCRDLVRYVDPGRSVERQLSAFGRGSSRSRAQRGTQPGRDEPYWRQTAHLDPGLACAPVVAGLALAFAPGRPAGRAHQAGRLVVIRLVVAVAPAVRPAGRGRRVAKGRTDGEEEECP